MDGLDTLPIIFYLSVYYLKSEIVYKNVYNKSGRFYVIGVRILFLDKLK